MALNKLKLGTALSTQITEQNDNLDEIEERLTEGVNRVIYLSAPEGDIKAFVDTLTEKNSIYLISINVSVTGLPVTSTASFQYGIAQVTFRGSYPFILLIGYGGHIATTSKAKDGWLTWTVHSGVSE